MFIILAMLLGIIILIFEISRPKVKGFFDFLRATSIIYFIAFVLSPCYLKILIHYNIKIDGWEWISINNFDDEIFIYAELMSLIGYFFIVAGFNLSKIYLHNSKIQSNSINSIYIDNSYGMLIMLKLGILTGIIGFLSFYIYSNSFDSFFSMIKYSGAMRSQIENTSKIAFLKNISPFIIISSYFFYSAMNYKINGKKTTIAIILFSITYCISLVLLYHMAGRLNLITYILIFPIISSIIKNKFNFKLIIICFIIFLFFIYLGKNIFNYFIDPSSLSNKIYQIKTGDFSFSSYLLLEFAFPIVNLANSIGYIVPNVIGYRYFTDFWLAIASMIPQRIFNLDLPKTISLLNTINYGSKGTIPVDIITFGYYCAGTIGVIFVTFLFGVLLRIFDMLLPYRQDISSIVFRTVWIIFLSFRIMYGDPSITLKGGFCLIVSTFIYIHFRKIYIKIDSTNLKIIKDNNL